MRKTHIMIIFFLLVLIPISTIASTHDNERQAVIDISVKPQKILFDLRNTKPGDSVARSFQIANNGKEQLTYLINNTFTDGSEHFYNQLLLQIKDEGENTIFNGKLKDFQQLDERTLQSETSENLLFLIEIPTELTNEFQGLGSEFQFKVYVEGTLGGVLPVDKRLPSTSTPFFNYFLIGSVFILIGASLYVYQRRNSIKNKQD
ncbi:TasA family protein [Salirhabdus salicampi]|uniref:TasA family protein n=1 Tax=Salirhabdus salicampi TaxID=476102 RepID=UPI0020C2AFDB|nr:TasA family protein [Salirhabdus salicampi]MCP8615768.1 hypothetical protein [Salirhabdus salicampi]